jgi:hypothetical protein
MARTRAHHDRRRVRYDTESRGAGTASRTG